MPRPEQGGGIAAAAGAESINGTITGMGVCVLNSWMGAGDMVWITLSIVVAGAGGASEDIGRGVVCATAKEGVCRLGLHQPD